MVIKTKYKVGDIVQLRSGGPEMTVKEIPDNDLFSNYYICQWFAGKKLASGNFQEESLEPVNLESK
ncbi:YodC family protein [Desulfovibrio aminophilus]|uniref:YodC family protein n=1 Tax=Desulfovibrio aminophilus TaxID=81425 RepID=UPI0004818885|nr:DUF2158 domain-containing protein [Desulfovibrio aminophilus]